MALGLHKKRDFRKPNQEEGITTFHFGVTRKSPLTPGSLSSRKSWPSDPEFPKEKRAPYMKREGAFGAILLALSTVFAFLLPEAFLGPSFAEYPARLSEEAGFRESPSKASFRAQWAAYLQLPSPTLLAEEVRLSGKTDAEGGFSLALPWPGVFARGRLCSSHGPLSLASFSLSLRFRSSERQTPQGIASFRLEVSGFLPAEVERFTVFLLRTKRISSLGKSSSRKLKSPGNRPGPNDGRTSGESLPRDRPRRVPRSTFPFPGTGSGKSGSIGDAGCGSLSSFPSPPQTPWIGQNPGSLPRQRPKKP